VFLLSELNMRNPIVSLVLVNAAFWTPIMVWLLRAALLAIPRNLESAARADGASRLTALVRVILPAAAPAVGAAIAIVFIGVWNDFVFVVVLGGYDTHTLVEFIAQSFTPPVNILAARIVLSALPCLALVAVFNRRLLRAL
jgi:multiple sugar transport system permease protein